MVSEINKIIIQKCTRQPHKPSNLKLVNFLYYRTRATKFTPGYYLEVRVQIGLAQSSPQYSFSYVHKANHWVHYNQFHCGSCGSYCGRRSILWFTKTILCTRTLKLYIKSLIPSLSVGAVYILFTSILQSQQSCCCPPFSNTVHQYLLWYHPLNFMFILNKIPFE